MKPVGVSALLSGKRSNYELFMVNITVSIWNPNRINHSDGSVETLFTNKDSGKEKVQL